MWKKTRLPGGLTHPLTSTPCHEITFHIRLIAGLGDATKERLVLSHALQAEQGCSSPLNGDLHGTAFSGMHFQKGVSTPGRQWEAPFMCH